MIKGNRPWTWKEQCSLIMDQEQLGLVCCTVGKGRVGVIERQGGGGEMGKKLHIGSYLEKTALQ